MNAPLPIYLDHHATTPVDPRVAAVVVSAMTETFGNPNSTYHLFGQKAAALIRGAAKQVAELVEAAPDDVRFTTGASESLRLALAYAEERSRRRPLRVAVSAIEHPALLEELAAGERSGRFELSWMNVDSLGCVLPQTIQSVVAAGIDLVCLMAANNEVGTIQPVQKAAAIARGAGAEVLVDATQAAGRVPLRCQHDQIDYLVLSAHKMYGPKGVGALIGPGLAEAPPPKGYARHQSTPNVAGIAGLGEAARLRTLEMAEDEARIAELRDRLQGALLAALPGLVVNGDPSLRLANNLHVSAPKAENDIVVAQLRETVAISTGAACVSGVDAPSHVLQAMHLEPWRQHGALRISLGRFNTAAEIDRAAAAIVTAVLDVQNLCA